MNKLAEKNILLYDDQSLTIRLMRSLEEIPLIYLLVLGEKEKKGQRKPTFSVTYIFHIFLM